MKKATSIRRIPYPSPSPTPAIVTVQQTNYTKIKRPASQSIRQLFPYSSRPIQTTGHSSNFRQRQTTAFKLVSPAHQGNKNGIVFFDQGLLLLPEKHYAVFL